MLRVDHLPQALALSRALGWPYRLEDWAIAHKLGRGFAIEVGEELAGTALWWPFGDRYASVGMIIVSTQYQRRGIGTSLIGALLADAADRTIFLNSTRDGLALYARLGFVPYGKVYQHQGHLAELPFAGEARAVRPLQVIDRFEIDELDRAATGMERTALLDALFALGAFKVVERGGRISGYGCLRRWGRGVVIGPIVATHADDARSLIAALAEAHVGQFVRIDVPEAALLSPWLEALGLPGVDEVVAMALGDRPCLGDGPRLFALSNQSLG